MFKKIMLAGALGAFSAASYAASFSVSVAADGSSRWYDYFSDAYAEIGQGFNGNPALDGFFLISTGQQIGGGVDLFPSEGDFANLFTVHYDETTGAITNLTDLKFNDYIRAAAPVTGVSYTTSLANISGTVQSVGGVVSGLSLDADITFTFDMSGLGIGLLPFTGNLSVGNDGSFALLADQTHQVNLLGQDYSVRLAWDVTGTVTSPAPVPLPASALLLGPGLAMLGFTRRRQARG